MPEHQNPLTDEELIEIRGIIEADKRAKWLWATIRTSAIWVAAVVTGFTVFWDTAGRILRTMVGK